MKLVAKVTKMGLALSLMLGAGSMSAEVKLDAKTIAAVKTVLPLLENFGDKGMAAKEYLELGLNLADFGVKFQGKDYANAQESLTEVTTSLNKLGDNGKKVAEFLSLGVGLSQFGLNFQKNVDGVKASLGNAKVAFQNQLESGAPGTVKDIVAQLKSPTVAADKKEHLAAQLNEQIILLVDTFSKFLTLSGSELFVPLMAVAESIPGLSDKMKFKSGTKFSTYTRENIKSFNDALTIEKNLAPKLIQIVDSKKQLEDSKKALEQAVEKVVKEAAEAGTPLPALPAPSAPEEQKSDFSNL